MNKKFSRMFNLKTANEAIFRFISMLAILSVICLPNRIQGDGCIEQGDYCEETHQDCNRSWFWNQKTLLIAVPVVAITAVLLYTNTNKYPSHFSYIPYGSNYFSTFSEFDKYYYHHHHSSLGYSYHSGSDSGYSDSSSFYSSRHHIGQVIPNLGLSKAIELRTTIKPVLMVEKIVCPVIFTASLIDANNELIDSSSITVDKPGIVDFNPICTNYGNDFYKITLSYATEIETPAEGVLTVFYSGEKDKTLTFPFKKLPHLLSGLLIEE